MKGRKDSLNLLNLRFLQSIQVEIPNELLAVRAQKKAPDLKNICGRSLYVKVVEVMVVDAVTQRGCAD